MAYRCSALQQIKRKARPKGKWAGLGNWCFRCATRERGKTLVPPQVFLCRNADIFNFTLTFVE